MGAVSEPTPDRPRQVTLAAWLIMAGSVMVVALVFDRLSGLHTIETRQSVERFLGEPAGDQLGLGIDGVLTLIRTVAMVAAGCATAATILGFQVLRRSRSARLALTVLAVPLFVAGMAAGGFFSSLVVAAVVMLWLPPARDWFRDAPASPGSAPASRRAAPAPSAPAPEPRSTVPPSPAAPTAPTAPTAPWGQAPARVPTVPPRPAAVVWACVLTWVSVTLTTLGMAAFSVVVAANPERFFDDARRQNPDLSAQGVTDQMLGVVTVLMVAGIVLWCVGAAVLAVLVLRRVEWARVVLIVSASVAAAVSLVGAAVGGFPLVLTLVAAAATIMLLLRPETRTWFGAPRR